MRPCLAKFLANPGKFAVITKPALSPLAVMPRIQTDGSFGNGSFGTGISRTAVLYRDRKGVDTVQCRTYFDHLNSTESEWCSVLDGVMYAVKKDEGFVELENDCLGVVQSIIRRRAKGGVATYYCDAIRDETKHFDYFGIRWIPRELNASHEIFQLRGDTGGPSTTSAAHAAL